MAMRTAPRYRNAAIVVTRTPAATLRRLRALRNNYGGEAEREKRALLALLRATRLATWAAVRALHEDLLFLCAFPGALATRALARRMLGEVEQRVRLLARAQRAAADDSGVAGSVTRHVYPFPVARWIAEVATLHADVDWKGFTDPALLDAYVGALSCDGEREAFESGEYTVRDWLRVARRMDAATDLEWLLKAAAVKSAPAHSQRLADAWDDAEVPLAWRLDDSPWSVTRNALPRVALAVRTGMRRPPSDVAAYVGQPLPGVERLARGPARRVVATARAALAARCREVNAMTYPNLDEVWWCELGEGVALAVIGIARELRLTLETNTGYLLFANGVPVGYGGVTPLFRQANTGINIFDPFRGGEAAFLWVQMLRAFHALYGSKRFVINAYQFGAGNAEAIQSGAFWFYYRLGFRPAAAQTRRLASREAQRIAADRKYRSESRTLRELATGDLYLDLPGFDPHDFFDEALLPRVGACAARELARVPTWSRHEAQKRVTAMVAASLGVNDLARWPAAQRRGFVLLAPIVAAAGGVQDWPRSERDALVALLRAKGAPQERDFALQSQRIPRFFRSLRAVLQDAR